MLWAITSYFNPCGYQKRLENYHLFRQHLKAPLIAVELGFNGHFDLTDSDADIMIRIADGDVMFQKERLLNLMIESHLPDNCDFIAWLDCDVILLRDDWSQQAVRVLEKIPIAQLFSRGHRIESPEGSYLDLENSRITSQKSFATRIQDGQIDLDQMIYSQGGSYYKGGLAWAARRELIAETGLYDGLIIGSGDRVIPHILTGTEKAINDYIGMTSEQIEHYLTWVARFQQVNPHDCGLVEGEAVQLWHGDYSNRQYQKRHSLYRQHGFDPRTELKRGSQGAWNWATPDSDLALKVLKYFENRREDDSLD